MDRPADILVSVVMAIGESDPGFADLIRDLRMMLEAKVKDYEIILVDNATRDGTMAVIEQLVEEVPNIQVYSLARACDRDIAVLAGLDNTIGDYVITMLPIREQVSVLPTMLDLAMTGTEVVFGRSDAGTAEQGWLYRAMTKAFFGLYRRVTGILIPADNTQFRLMSRRVVNYLLQSEPSHIMLQALPAMSAFRSRSIDYTLSSRGRLQQRRTLGSGLHKALSLVLSTTAFPARMLSVLALTAGLLNLLYAVYVIAIAVFKTGVAEGWTTLSLQISGMFFLVSMILALLSEYIVRIFEGSFRRPLYMVAREMSSATLSRQQRLNILHNLPAKPKKTGTL
ncbi:MAG TPA: glycosyltransferase [Methylomirabilota bacterium]|nr:glycosyltransferase [Methylomirabilota bacterium]